ncbi:MAG: right-handed parallel beta-helix repeat-containing protein, partial [Candidatus Heimdallarchaeota archaeon]
MLGNVLHFSARYDSNSISAEKYLVKDPEFTSLFEDSQIHNLETKDVQLRDNIFSYTELPPDLIPSEEINVQNDSAFETYGFPGIGSKDEPYLIENYSINSSYVFGIIIENTSKYFAIHNCFLNNTHGIYINDVANYTATLSNNICLSSISGSNGISITDSNFCTISDNLCTENNYGISLSNSIGTILKNNTCSHNQGTFGGIYLDQCSNCTLSMNNCIRNTYGICVQYSDEISLRDNICENNSVMGIAIGAMTINELSGNNCSYSTVGIAGGSNYGAVPFVNNTCNNNYFGFMFGGSNQTFTNNTCENNEYGM